MYKIYENMYSLLNLDVSLHMGMHCLMLAVKKVLILILYWPKSWLSSTLPWMDLFDLLGIWKILILFFFLNLV